MKKTLLFALLLTITLFSRAQLNGDGFYRVQNVVTGRYIKVADNRGSLNIPAATADLGAIRTIRDFENVVSDPGTIIYIQKYDNNGSPRYDLKAQGTGVYEIVGHYSQIKETRKGGTYHAFATAYGQTAYVADEYYLVNGEEGHFEEIGVIDPKETKTREWWIHPMSQDEGRYFGIQPEWGNGASYYSTFYAAFPFSFHSEGMKAYYICAIDSQYGIAVWKEINGDIPASMPVIITSATNNPATNRLDIHTSNAKAAKDNLLRGVYFDLEKGPHANRTSYDAATMRVLGQLEDGSLGFKKSDMKYIPANKAYLPVPKNAPDELKIMTSSEYEAFLSAIEENKRDTVTVRVNNATKIYGEDNPQFTYTLENAPEHVTIETLAAQPVLTTDAGKFSDVGKYAITASGAVMDKCVFVYVDGTLTITQASQTIECDDNGIEVEVTNKASFTAYATSNLPLTANIDNKLIASIEQKDFSTFVVTGLMPGSTTIKLTQEGNKNYKAAQSVVVRVTVNPEDGIQNATVANDADIYDLLGRKIKDKTHLKGIYIVNGRKTIF